MYKNKIKLLGRGILAVIMAIIIFYFNPAAQAAGIDTPPVYTDLTPTNPDISYVIYLSEKRIITGYPDGSFKPQEGLTRAQAATVIAKAANLSLDQSAESPFKDLSTEHWARPYIAAAVKAGYINGFPDGSFQPDQPLSRAQAISLILRLSKQPQTASLPILKDINNQHWAASAVAVGLASGMTGLSADGQYYLPDAPFSRINMAHALGILLTHEPDLSTTSLPGKLKPNQGKVTVIKAGSQIESELNAETIVNQGDTIITKKGASAELNYPDGSSMLIKENSQIKIKEAKGRKYVQSNGQEGIAVDWLNLDMKQGSMFSALANKHESTENTEITESSNTSLTSQFVGMKRMTLASLDGREFVAAAAKSNNQEMPWYQSGKTKKVKLKVDMPWGIAAVRGTFILISVTPDGHATVSCLTGTAEVSNAGQTIPLSQNQSTSVSAAVSPPENATSMTQEAKQQFNQVQDWVVNTALQIDVNKETSTAPVVEMIVEIPDQPISETTPVNQVETTLDAVLNALESSGITITEEVKQDLRQQLQNLQQEQSETVDKVLKMPAASQSNSNQSSRSSSSSSVLYISYSSPGTYGPNTPAESQTVAKNVIVSSKDVTLQNMIITGDLTLAAGIGEGSVTLNNITVQGNTNILGGGSNSIHIIDCGLYTVTVDNKTNTVRIIAEGNSSLGTLTLLSGAILEENALSGTGFSTVNTGSSLPDGATIILTGNFAAVNINSPGLIIQVTGGSIDQMDIASNATGASLNLASGINISNLQINAAAQISGAGTIALASINANGVVFADAPAKWVLGPGVTSVNIAGKDTTQTFRKIRGTVSLPEKFDQDLQVCIFADTDKAVFGNYTDYYWTEEMITVPANTLSVAYELIIPPNEAGSGYIVGYDYYGEADYLQYGYYSSNSTVFSWTDAELVDLSSTDRSGIDLTLIIGKKISGTITLPENVTAPTEGMIVNIWAQSGLHIFSDSTATIAEGDSSVNFILTGMTSGMYRLHYSIQQGYNADNRLLQQGFYKDGAQAVWESADSSLIDLSTVDHASINLILAQGNVLSGTISLPEPLNGDLYLVTYSNSEGYAYQDMPGLDLSAELDIPFCMVAPSAAGYRLNYYISDNYIGNKYVRNAYYREGASCTTNYSSASLIDLSSGDKTDISFALLTGKNISGTISLPEGYALPAEGIDISIWAQAEDGEHVVVNQKMLDTSADYSLTAPAGSVYCLFYEMYQPSCSSVDSPGSEYVRNAYKKGLVSTTDYNSADSFTLTEDMNGMDMVLLTGNKISGTFSLPQGYTAPAEGLNLSIQVHAENEDLYYYAYTNIYIPSGENSARYVITAPAADGYKLYYSLYSGFAEENGYLSYGYYGVEGSAANYFDAALIDISTGNQEDINFTLLKASDTQGATATVWTTGNPPLHEMEEILMFKVVDADANIDSNNIDTVTVRIYSDSDTNGFEQTINESAINSGEFTGIVKISTITNSTSDPTTIKAGVGDKVIIEYIDDLDANGNINQIKNTFITVIAIVPTMTKLTATVDGVDIESTDGTLTVVQGSVTSVIKVDMSEPVSLIGTPIVMINIDGVDHEYGIITLDPVDTTNKTLIITPNGSNGTAGLVGTFTVTVAQDSVEDADENGNALTTFSLTVIATSDISDSFTDSNFKQAVWEWLGNSGTPGTFTKQDLIDWMAAKNYTLEVSGKNIISLAGLENFEGTDLIALYCGLNQLTSLPSLPTSLKDLDCYSNQLSSLPELPSSLEYLDCYYNQLTSLPSLPNSLTHLYCYSNQLTSLPTLPDNLASLCCYSNQLTSLPILPDNLADLRCYSNQLTSLPELPNRLTHLYCYNNQLSSLPELPNRLGYLYCYNNQLTSLPELPNRFFIRLHCYNNFVNVFDGAIKTYLDDIPASYKTITPQYRYGYTGADIEMSIAETRKLAESDIALQESSDGTIWSYVADATISDFTFSSSDDAVATVNSSGLITANASGICTIYAKYGNIDSDFTVVTITVTVK